jgi:hypothetical protein
MRLIEKLRGIRQSLAFKYMPKIANLSAWAATFESSQKLKSTGAIKLLLDSTVLAHAITHESAWIDTGPKMWGGQVRIDTGYVARIPVHSVDNHTREYRDICFLTGISHLARRHHLKLLTSSELMAEQNRHPPARFRSVDLSGMSLFDGVSIESVDGWNFDSLIHARRNEDENLARLQRTRLSSSGDELYEKLMSIFGHENHSQDAWHIRTAEKHGCFAFITMDYKLLRILESHRSKIDKLNLRTRVLSPEQFGENFRIKPVAPYLFSYTNASFPVRSDLCWPDERRRSTRRRSKKQE